MRPRIAIIIQARLASTRLPRKMILPFFEEKGILQVLLERIKIAFPELPLWVATSESESCDELSVLCEQLNVNCYRGNENNVLSRFVNIINKEKYEYVIRVCADNPFLDLESIKVLIDYLSNNVGIDYVSQKTDEGKPVIKSHLGFFAELIKADVLKQINAVEGLLPLYSEHVTNYLYENPGYNIKLLPILDKFNSHCEIRLTIDTIEDFNLAMLLFKKTFYKGEIDYNKLIRMINLNDDIKERMKHQIIQNGK